MKIIDVSMPIQEDMQYYPGETQYTHQSVYSLANGDQGNSSKLILSSHCGTHIDPMSHVKDGGYSADQEDLSKLIGTSQLIDLTNIEGTTIDKEHLLDFDIDCSIVLIKTQNSTRKRSGALDLDQVITLSPSSARYLTTIGLDAIGLDSLTIGDGETHRLLLDAGIVIIEGLNFYDVSSGTYQFICLPLRLVGMDGAPSRAILVEGNIAELFTANKV